MNFTDQVATYIREQDLDLKNLVIVLPSRRAAKHLAASLFHAYGKPLIAPEMITMDAWIASLSSKTVIDRTRILMQLFEIHLAQAETDIDFSFDEFMTWGNTLLADFDEIDRYLIDSRDLFRNLRDIKEIENWSFGNETLTSSQERFLQFWDRLPVYYEKLRQRLDLKDCTNAGFAFKELAENIDRVFAGNRDRHFVFAGFNALSRAEISIMKQLHTMGRGHILINADRFYLDNPVHEAGMFLRELKKELSVKELPFERNTLAQDAKEVHLYECTQVTGQAHIAGTLLAGFTPEKIRKTLILLADETLIVPTLRNLPANIGTANITLGLPLKNTPVRSWVDLIFSIRENHRRFRTSGMYHKDFFQVFNHPFTSSMLPDAEKARLTEVENRVARHNKLFINPAHEANRIGPVADKLLELMNRSWNEDFIAGTALIRETNRFIYSCLGKQFNFEKAVLQAFDSALAEFENILSEGIPAMSQRTFRSLFNQHWSNHAVAYHGDPLEGLQVMGLLETRLLDFETIICVGMNEGVMPPNNPIQSIIPMDLRRYAGLPTPREKQGLFAHHFYRLLHACKELHVSYSKAQESVGSNEKSRYLLQLELELARANPEINLRHHYYTLREPGQNTREHAVKQKTPEILQRLDEMIAHSVSASMLKKYLNCPLDFYYRYVLEFYEEERVEEDIRSHSFGTAIHETLEVLYEPHALYTKHGERKPGPVPSLQVEDIEKMLRQFQYILRQKFVALFDQDDEAVNKGKNLLSFEMATRLTKRFLESERDFLRQQTEPVFIHSLERTYTMEIELEIAGEHKKVRLKGNIDRIDLVGDRTRIIDYKTGVVKTEDVSLKPRDNPENHFLSSIRDNKHILQLFFYNFLFLRNEGYLPEMTEIVSFISGGDTHFPMQTGTYTLNELMELFPEMIANILSDLYDTEQPFEHIERGAFSFCMYC